MEKEKVISQRLDYIDIATLTHRGSDPRKKNKFFLLKIINKSYVESII